MAGEHRSLERRDLKMGKSKFPGKPAKFICRRRVNLRKCSRPVNNESSLAAENICHGLSIFNKTFGNEQEFPKQFPGFSPAEIEDAMAEARLQQKETEAEYKKKGVHVNLWSEFQTELFSIFQPSPSNKPQPIINSAVCFDGGGSDSDGNNSENFGSYDKSSVGDRIESKYIEPALRGEVCLSVNQPEVSVEKRKRLLRSLASMSLQSQAAKRLLDKAKKVTISEGNEKKKFVLPTRRSKSSRVIKPNKRFLELEETVEETPKSEVSTPPRPAGRVILREARLQLEHPPISLAEGPFSSPTLKRRANLVSCGVCGAIRFYKFIKQATKFGIKSCESCRKFISKVIKARSTLGKGSMRCAQGAGLCMVPAVARNADWSTLRMSSNARCQACWLKLCLKNFLIPEKLKGRLMALLPPEMQTDSSVQLRNDANVFSLSESRISFFDSFTNAREKTDIPKMEKMNPTLVKSKDGKKDGSKKKCYGRQRQPLGGPRVKHVCRSASVVLGQPVATFPERPASDTCCAPVKSAPSKHPVATSNTQPVVAAQTQQNRKKRVIPAPADNLVSMDFWEIYDPEEVCEAGFSLIGSEPFSVRALCYLCGSAGVEKMVHCACCCEPYHEFCVGESSIKGEKSGWRWDWVCPRCTICVACGRASGQQLTCVRCDNSYHTECVGGRLHHSPDRPWVCSACLRCKSCNAEDVTVFVGNLPLCKPCFILRQKGNYCPLCQRCYEEDDYDSKMMECGGCRSWVHAKCEGVSDEKYQVLSFLPESVEFVCRMCCAMPPAPWWLAVEAELKTGYLGVLKALSKNRTACKMLKWSPKKICSCRRRESAKHSEEDGLGLEGVDRSPAPASDSGIGSADDELRATLEEDACFCFLEVDSYNSRSKPFSPNLLSIKKKVTDSEYSSLTQFHEDMRSMIETTQSEELMDVYHVAMREVFPWFDPKGARVLGASRGGSLDNTPVKASPTKQPNPLPCLVPVDQLLDRPLEYFYQDCGLQDTRMCLFCKAVGDGPSEKTGRLLYCGQNEWVHCNCALWSGEVFEEIDGSLQNVHSAVSRGRSIRCPHCGLKGASVGCCARNCSETFHFACARTCGCIFLEDKSVYCPSHVHEAGDRLAEVDKAFELRRPVYVELDKRRSKPVESTAVRVAVGALHVEALGRFIPELSDLPETIIPADLVASRLFWSSREPWRLVRYRLSVRLVEPEQVEGVDLGVNLTVDHSKPDEDAKMRALRHFQVHLTLPSEPPPSRTKRKRRLPEFMDESDNQDLLPPEIEEAILKELSHDMLEGISVQDIFQDMSERDETDEEWIARPRKTATLRSGNRNAKDKADSRWKRKAQEGKENKMVGWCTRLLQVDGAIDSSSGSEAGESPGRSLDAPVDIPQLDGAQDSDYESCDGLPDTEEAPVECAKCRCTYRTQRSYERHLESRCHDLLLSSSEDDDEPLPPPPPSVKPAQPRTYTRRRPVPPTHPPVALPMPQPVIVPSPPNPVPVILQEVPYQPMVQYIMEPQKPMLVPSTYQVVLPPSPVMLGSQSTMFEVVTDPHTGGVFLTQPSPQPVLYNMETIVSNTVMQTNQFMTSSFSQTSTQVFQASKQIVNMPTSFVLAPSDLICVPVAPAMPQTPVSASWSPPKLSKLEAVKPEVVHRPPPPPNKPKPRSRPLVDFINNFKIDSADLASQESLPSPVQHRQAQYPNNNRRPPADQHQPIIKSNQRVSTSPPVKQHLNPPPTVRSNQNFQSLSCYQEQPLSAKLEISKPLSVLSQTHATPEPMKPLLTPVSEPQQQLSISMPSLDDSPPNSCDNSPSLTCVSLAVSPSTQASRRQTSFSSPPSPFLSPQAVTQASPLHYLPSFTPPIPPQNHLVSTCDPLPPIGCSAIQLESLKIPKCPVPPVTPPRTPQSSPTTTQLSCPSPLTLPPPRLPSKVVVQPLIEPQQQSQSILPRVSDEDRCVKELKITPRLVEPEGPQLVYDVVSDDGFKFSSTSLADVWQKVCESVQEVRAAYHMPTLQMTPRSFETLGLNNHGLQHMLEQLPGVGTCKKYQPKYFKQPRNTDDDMTPIKENVTGCARSEGYTERKQVDKFGWLASRHRKVPRVAESADDSASTRKTNNLPMAMRYRALREANKADLFVYRSKIHGMGLFCTREIEAGDMVIEYSGELIRSCLTDKREKQYTDKGIGCYMFRIDDHYVVDATMKGSPARFINHSCEPNCYSKVVDILGRKHIIIFALRRINVMEELTYDYKFPFEDVKISCHCQSKKCRKYLN